MRPRSECSKDVLQICMFCSLSTLSVRKINLEIVTNVVYSLVSTAVVLSGGTFGEKNRLDYQSYFPMMYIVERLLSGFVIILLYFISQRPDRTGEWGNRNHARLWNQHARAI